MDRTSTSTKTKLANKQNLLVLLEFWLQRMFKLPHNCTHLIRSQSNAQNSPSQISTVCEPWISRCSNWIYKRQRNQRSNYKHPLDHWESKRVPEKNHLFCFIDYTKAFDCESQQTGNSSRDGNTSHLTSLRRDLYAGHEATVRTGHGTIYWFQIMRSTWRLYIVTLLV